MENLKPWHRSMQWALGNLDEAVFALSTFMLEIKKTPSYLSQPEELALLAESATISEAENELRAQPPLPEVYITPFSLPRLASAPGLIAKRYRTFRLQYSSAVDSGYPVNDTVWGYYLERNSSPETPVVIYLHGWMEFEHGMSLRLPLAWLANTPFNILALHLPFHFERTPPGTASGELSITGNLPLAIKGMRQAVSDVRQAVAWLKHRVPGAKPKVAILGKSLGGLISAMTLIAETKLEAGVLVVPATASRASIWQSRYTRLVRRDLLLQGLTEKTTARLLEALSPESFRPAIDPQRILVFKAAADRVCFPADTDRFVNQWGVPFVEVPTGHLTATFHPRARQLSQAHLQKFLLD
ncbi:MAG TPA: CocE/NonD family hydrolase [Chloroflexia bacterium]|nr:CocE/NonD family hydrolase [Chloroflexia bacterium]